MATIVYLDADDEITSAAARIRTADDARVGLVLPFGSRVATSRINFRLPDQLKTRIEEAAGRDGLSVNAWLVRAATAAVQT